MKRIFLIPLLLSFAFSLAEAREEPKFYNSVRCQGMGGACIGVVNDETALIVNPAALGKLRNFYGTILDPELEANTNVIDIYNSNKGLQPFQLDSVKPGLDANPDRYYHARAQMFPSFVARNFGIGILGKYTLNAREATDLSTIDTFYQNDLAFILGYNLRLFDGRLKVGFNTKLISRIEVNNTALSATGPLDYKSIASEGVGLSTDVGVILSAPWDYLPSITGVLHDVGGTSFDKAHGVRLDTTDRPQSVSQDLDVAFSLFPIHANNVRSSFTFEYDGLLSLSQEADKAKRMHAGMEFNFSDILFLRGGYNQRYWTAGVEVSTEHFQIQASSYGEEIGDQTSPQEDRRYTLKLAWRF